MISHDRMLRFSFATTAEVPAVVALVESAYRGDASRVGWTTEADLLDGQRTDPDEVVELIARADARIILAHQDEVLVGSVLVTAFEGEGYLGMFAVSPTLQGGGLGRALLGEAERVMHAELGCATGKMTVIVQRAELIAWYERRGWTLTGEREPFPYGRLRSGMPRREDLEFVVLKKPLTP
jgi:ribosomal protein S18 acetylase RimI-like enzyme